MATELILVRHPPVAKAWTGRCYGQSDMGLSREGQAMIPALVDELAALRPDYIAHSDMRRTRELALPLARRLGLIAHPAPYWRERHFGTWEGQRWNAIYSGTGNAMDGMLDAPDSFRPGNEGETTRELIQRVALAIDAIPKTGRTIIVAHGGSIAAARLLSAKAPACEIANYIPHVGEAVSIEWAWTMPQN